MTSSRRIFLKQVTAMGGAWISPRVWAARIPVSGPRLIVVFLRGAVDGLNVVVPYTESAYYEHRPTIAIARPGQTDGTLDLDGRFGLHPALASVMPLWRDKSLAFVQACGSLDPTRSHFEGQAYMESASIGGNLPSGWLNRLTAALPVPKTPTTAVSFSAAMPHIFEGPATVTNFPLGRGVAHPTPTDRPVVETLFGHLYAGDTALDRAYRNGLAARRELLAALHTDMEESAQGAPGAEAFTADATQAARLMAADPSLRLAFLDVSGWDTHVNEGGAHGQLAMRLRGLGDGLMALRQGLASVYDQTLIYICSEFGRTVHENGNRGTDHGHGNVHWLLGAVHGGKIFGSWPGLDHESLYQGRDLAVTTDYRTLIEAILIRHLNLPARTRRDVLPGFQGSAPETLPI